MGKWFLKLSQYSILDGCKKYVGAPWCFEFIFDIFKVGIKNHLMLHFVSNSVEEVLENKVRQRQGKEGRKREKETNRPPAI